MIVLVCGGRDLTDRAYVFAKLDALHRHTPITLIVQGGAAGADALAYEWARSRGVHCAQVDALWDHHGRAAGPIRNQTMLLLNPRYVVAFKGGRGTDHMIKTARSRGVPVLEFFEESSSV